MHNHYNKAKNLGAEIKEFLRQKHYSVRIFADKNYQQLGFKDKRTAFTYLAKVTKGTIYGTTASKKHSEENLQKLARTLRVAGMEETHPIIGRLIAFDDRFTYAQQPSLEEMVDTLPERDQIRKDIKQLYVNFLSGKR